MWTRLKRAVRDKDGTMVIETAVVLPPFLFLLFGIFEFSLALTGYCSATYAVRVAARYASIHSSTSLAPTSTAALTTMVQSNLFLPGVSTSNISVNYYNFYAASQGNYIGDAVGVAIAWSFPVNLPGYHKTFTPGSTAYRMVIR